MSAARGEHLDFSGTSQVEMWASVERTLEVHSGYVQICLANRRGEVEPGLRELNLKMLPIKEHLLLCCALCVLCAVYLCLLFSSSQVYLAIARFIPVCCLLYFALLTVLWLVDIFCSSFNMPTSSKEQL